MQEDMRLKMPAAPDLRAERAEVRVMLWDDGSDGGRGRCYVSLYPEPGRPLEIDPRDYVPKLAPGVYAAPESWKRMVSRTATGVIIGARPGQADDEAEIYIDLPETTAAWLAVRILEALAKPHVVNEIVAEEGYCPGGMTLEAARRTIAEAYAKAQPHD